MTVMQVYQLALSLLPTNPQEDDSLRQYMVGWTNMVLAETFDIENSIRVDRGEQELTEIPQVASEADLIPASDGIARYAIPYFMASLMAKDDDDDFWAETYRNRYIVALDELRKSTPEMITDEYRNIRYQYDA